MVRTLIASWSRSSAVKGRTKTSKIPEFSTFIYTECMRPCLAWMVILDQAAIGLDLGVSLTPRHF